MKSIEGKAVWHVSTATPWHSSRTLSAAHAPVTHVKAPQTDFHVKPDNSSGSTHDIPSERPLRTKATFQHGKAPKKHRGKPWGTKGETTTQAKHGPTPLHAPSSHGIGTKARRAASKPRRHPTSLPRAMEEASKQQVGLHGSTRSGHLSLQGFGFDWSRLPIP